MIELEKEAGRFEHADKLSQNDFAAMCKSVKRFTVYVNEFFMKRARVFLDTVANERGDGYPALLGTSGIRTRQRSDPPTSVGYRSRQVVPA